MNHRPRASGCRIERVALATAALCVALAQGATFRGVRLDDAYITFRYAQNLACGRGFVFNVGQRVMGSTSPGEVLLAVGVYPLVGRDLLPSAMAVLGCVAWTAQAVCLYLLLRDAIGRWRAGVVAAGIAAGLAGSPMWVALETNAAVAATLAVFVFALRSRWMLAATACAVAGVLRADAHLVLVPLAILCVARTRSRAWKPGLLFAILAAPWPLFATRYFGSVVPLSISKAHFTTSVQYALHVLRDVPRPFQPPSSLTQVTPWIGLAFWLLALAGAWVLVRSDRRLLAFVAYGLLQASFYVALAPNPAFGWHLYPVCLVAFVLALTAVATIAEGIARPAWRWALTFGLLGLGATPTMRFARSYATEDWYGARDAIYRKVAGWLVTHAEPNDIVSAEEVGTIGYYSGLKMNDRTGLVTRYPGDVYWRLAHRVPTHLRWLVLNGTEVETGRDRQYYEGRPTTLLLEAGWGIYVVDVKAPRQDGDRSPWDGPG